MLATLVVVIAAVTAVIAVIAVIVIAAVTPVIAQLVSAMDALVVVGAPGFALRGRFFWISVPAGPLSTGSVTGLPGL